MKFFSLLIFLLIFNLRAVAQLPGNVIEFDGDGDWAVTSTVILNNLTSVTIESWVKAFSDGQFLSNHSPGSTWESVELSTVWFIINAGDGSGSRQILYFDNLADSVWHHIAAVWNGSEMMVYLDGTEYAGPETATNPPWSSFVAVGIGSRRGQTSFLNGQIDEMRIWNRALSIEQIQATMNDTLGAEYYSSTDSGLIAYWRFDELENLGVWNSGTDDVRDFSVSGVHADLEGDAFLTSSGVSGFDDKILTIPEDYHLQQNFPNPFNPSTKIKYSLPRKSTVVVKVYDVLGNEIQTLVSEEKTAGTYEMTWNAASLPSGIYFYQLRAGNIIQTKKMVLMK